MGGWPQKFNLEIDDDMVIEVKTQRPIPKSSRIKNTKMSEIFETGLSSENDIIEEVVKNSTNKETTEVKTPQLNIQKVQK